MAQIGDEMGHLEQGFVHLGELSRVTRLVIAPPHALPPVADELIHDIGHESE